uniref:Uncharacterized protein n=1 Tax=Anguilla anguilla TaxID=7936 RepID=A0A0E9WFT4_ANGAN
MNSGSCTVAIIESYNSTIIEA